MVPKRWLSRDEALELRRDLTWDRLQAALQRGDIEARNRFTHWPIPPSDWLPHTFRNRTLPRDPEAERIRSKLEFGNFLFDPNVDMTCDYPDGIADIPPGSAEFLRADVEALDDPSDDDDSKQAREARAIAWAQQLSPDEFRTKQQLCDYAVIEFGVTPTAFERRIWPRAPAHLRRQGAPTQEVKRRREEVERLRRNTRNKTP